MSQKKVDEYKARKKTRVEDEKKARRSLFIQNFCIVAVVLGVFSWFGYSMMSGMVNRQESVVQVHSMNTQAIANYFDDLSESFNSSDDSVSESNVDSENVEETVSEEVES